MKPHQSTGQYANSYSGRFSNSDSTLSKGSSVEGRSTLSLHEGVGECLLLVDDGRGGQVEVGGGDGYCCVDQ